MPTMDLDTKQIAVVKEQVTDAGAEAFRLIEAILNGSSKGFLTYAALVAAVAEVDVEDQPVIKANTFHRVTNDPDPANNWLWQWDGTTLTKSDRDDLAQAKAYADANRLFKPFVLAAAADFNTLTAEGRTVVPTNVIAAACTNRPSGDAGVLDVALIGSGAFQTYRVFEFDLAYERQRLSNATWTAWTQLASKDMVDTSAANTLQSAQDYADAEKATLVSVEKPKQTGRANGWPDAFFRRLTLTSQNFLGRKRWWANGVTGTAGFNGWSLVTNSVFKGKALRRADGYNGTSYSGPTIHFDEINVAAGDYVTAYVLIVGNGNTAYATWRFTNESETIIGSVGLMVNAAGTNPITPSSTPQFLRVTAQVPAGATRLSVSPYNISGSVGFDVIAVWCGKGGVSDVPSWPTLEDSYAILREAELVNAPTVNSAGQLRGAYIPHIQYQSPLGDSEMIGDGNYAGLAKTGGFYELITEKTLLNAVTGRIWASNGSTAVEWRVWVRDTASGFNMETTTATLSGSVAAGSFPTTNVEFTLQMPTILSIDAGKYLFVMFKPADDSAINFRSWTYNAGVTPARHGFPFTVAAGGWNNTIAIGNPSTSYGQAACRFLLESEDIRAVKKASGITYDPAASGLAAQTVQAAIDALAASVTTPPTILAVPMIYGVIGREANVYLDNLIAADVCDYNTDVVATVGTQQAERWTVTPTATVTGGTLGINLHDKKTAAIAASRTLGLKVVAASAGSGMTKKIIVIGDSLVSAGLITQTLLDIVSGGDAMAVTLLGTQGTAPNLHEGRGGWAVPNYTTAGSTYYSFTVAGVVTPPNINATQYTNNGSTYRVQAVNLSGGAGTIICSVVSGGAPASSGVLTKSNAIAGDATIAFSASSPVAGNPFWFSGAVNFAQYLSTNSIAAPDWVFIQLGVNDMFGQVSDSAASTTADTRFTSLDALISSIKSADANIKIGMMIPPPPAASQDAFGANYASTETRWRHKRNMYIWARQMLLKYTGQEASRIYIVPTGLSVDTVNNYPKAAASPVNSRNSTVTISRQSNGVHPDISGYRQIGDALFAFIKCTA